MLRFPCTMGKAKLTDNSSEAHYSGLSLVKLLQVTTTVN